MLLKYNEVTESLYWVKAWMRDCQHPSQAINSDVRCLHLDVPQALTYAPESPCYDRMANLFIKEIIHGHIDPPHGF